MNWNSRQIIVIVAAVVLIAAGAIFYFVSRPADVDLGTAGGGTGGGAQASSALLEPGPLGEMALGEANAPNTVIEYVSMTCPHCARFHNDVYPAFKTKYIDTGKVRFILREFPLDPLATSAIMLARCQPADRYFPLVDLMFEQQNSWAFVQDPKTALINLVKQAGISEEQFTACLTNQSILDGVNWVKNRASKEFGVDSTPTFFFNGEKRSGELSLEEIDKILGG